MSQYVVLQDSEADRQSDLYRIDLYSHGDQRYYLSDTLIFESRKRIERGSRSYGIHAALRTSFATRVSSETSSGKYSLFGSMPRDRLS